MLCTAAVCAGLNVTYLETLHTLAGSRGPLDVTLESLSQRLWCSPEPSACVEMAAVVAHQVLEAFMIVAHPHHDALPALVTYFYESRKRRTKSQTSLASSN